MVHWFLIVALFQGLAVRISLCRVGLLGRKGKEQQWGHSHSRKSHVHRSTLQGNGIAKFFRQSVIVYMFSHWFLGCSESYCRHVIPSFWLPGDPLLREPLQQEQPGENGKVLGQGIRQNVAQGTLRKVPAKTRSTLASAQVWPLTQLFSLRFGWSMICLEGKSIASHRRGDCSLSFLVSALDPGKAFLGDTATSRGPQPRPVPSISPRKFPELHTE